MAQGGASRGSDALSEGFSGAEIEAAVKGAILDAFMDGRRVPTTADMERRVRSIRKRRGLSQEDMISFGFSARHWQQIEAGRPITVKTLLRISDAFNVRIVQLVRGLDRK